jgi:hypothetical protein
MRKSTFGFDEPAADACAANARTNASRMRRGRVLMDTGSVGGAANHVTV